jgi:hypothetical protein
MEGLDTLVFYLAEYDNGDNDMKAFVMFDFASELYTIYGSRQTPHKKKRNKNNPFYFMAKHADDVAAFLCNIVDTDNKFTYALYTFNCLPVNPNDMNFEMLYDLIDSSCELAAFDNCKLDENRIKSMTKLTSRIFSLYEFNDYQEDENCECYKCECCGEYECTDEAGF